MPQDELAHSGVGLGCQNRATSFRVGTPGPLNESLNRQNNPFETSL